jgi:hypothetical protein
MQRRMPRRCSSRWAPGKSMGRAGGGAMVLSACLPPIMPCIALGFRERWQTFIRRRLKNRWRTFTRPTMSATISSRTQHTRCTGKLSDDDCESVTQVRSRKAHSRCATDAREANGAQLLMSATSGACGFSAIALLLNLESFLFRTNSRNLRRIESCPLNINPRCPNFTHSPKSS